MARRKWETFPGKMRFCCDGRLMCGQDIGVFAFAIGLITVASGVFFGFTCPYLSSNVSPAIPVFAGVLMLMSLAMLVRTGTMDPGILPRATGLEAEVNETGRNQTIGADDQPRPASEGYTPPARTKMVTIQNMEGTVEVERMLKYCFTCKIFRPPRASHCSICDACVDQFDHHCPWVGNCVGRRNYRYFYGFLATLSLYCIYVLAFGILHLVLLSKEYDSFSAVSRKAPLTLVIVIIAFFAMWSVIGMCGYHTMLVGNAKTTNEEIKVTYGSNARQSTKNPYHQGSAWENLKYTLCAPLPRSLLDRRGQLTDDEYYAIRDETINSASSAARNLMGTTLPSSSSPSSSLSVTRVANTAPLRQTDPAEGDRLMTAE
ncbi:palmitoyltransferase ZDHHC9-like [Sycon ciliatum]|uniref:palmitoyltransferase ZDHHC9-like n=1 Tax=Sycon ciliatum TaxID=27933 RepID=UPI0020AE0041|eukprot:scpid75854/ scgid0878/ Palmitoyltransferase ZDHHC9; Zinc finger DHHC domain-containing protein 9